MAQFHSLEGLRYRYMQKILQKAKTTPHCTNVSHCIIITITHPNKTTNSGDGGWRLLSTTFTSQLGQFPHCMPSVSAPNSTQSQVWSSPPPWFPLQTVTLGLHWCVQQQNLACIARPSLCQVCFKTVCVIHLVNICFFSQCSFSPWTSPFTSYSAGGFQFLSSLRWK